MADTGGEQPLELRVGNAERRAAMEALDTHVEAGRLSIDEYGDRSAAASIATHVSDLTTLFADLPAPHPPMPRRAGEEAPLAPHEVYARPARPEDRPERAPDASAAAARGVLMVLVLALPAIMLLGAAGGAVGGAVLFLPLLFLLAGSMGHHHRHGRGE